MKLEQLSPPTRRQLMQASGVAKTAAEEGWPDYCRACRARYSVISEILHRIWDDDLSGKTILDWGSAVGGVAIILDDELPVSVTAALTPGQPLPFDDGVFDAVYGISVLTHIPPEFQAYYLGELKRIVKPDGVVILTVKSYKAVDRAQKNNLDPLIHPHTHEQLEKAGIIYASYPEHVLQKMDFAKHGDYGITYHSTDYIEKQFGKFFTFDKEDPKIIGHQDVLVMRPRRRVREDELG